MGGGFPGSRLWEKHLSTPFFGLHCLVTNSPKLSSFKQLLAGTPVVSSQTLLAGTQGTKGHCSLLGFLQLQQAVLSMIWKTPPVKIRDFETIPASRLGAVLAFTSLLTAVTMVLLKGELPSR